MRGRGDSELKKVDAILEKAVIEELRGFLLGELENLPDMRTGSW
ncbi:MAG TPA: hypothetical protein VN455_03105 [Methanotrichaceae archaeon]|nr:hypothetical protein [Methanotrichaceae archaeon]